MASFQPRDGIQKQVDSMRASLPKLNPEDRLAIEQCIAALEFDGGDAGGAAVTPQMRDARQFADQRVAETALVIEASRHAIAAGAAVDALHRNGSARLPQPAPPPDRHAAAD